MGEDRTNYLEGRTGDFSQVAARDKGIKMGKSSTEVRKVLM